MPPKPPKTRYFKGKAPNAAASESESDEDDQEEVDFRQQNRNKITRLDPNTVAGGAGRVISDVREISTKKNKGMEINLGGAKIGRGVGDGGVKLEESSGEEESESEEEDPSPPVKSTQQPKEEESSEYETDSEEEESEEEPPKPVFRPVFVPKGSRNTTAEKAAAEAEEARKREEEMEEQRKQASKELAGETIRRELAEKEAAKIVHDIDDTDGLDPQAEFEGWQARELARLLREERAQAERDAEKEEIERRRAMPEAERLREDMEHAQKTREKEKGEMGFLQKYYHKGAFHQDDELLKRDYAGATESSVDMTMLPKVMQVRDFGKASRTKYTHLADQDTSQGGWGAAIRGGGGATGTGCFNCGGPHLRRDCPNNDLNGPGMIGGVSIPGASAPAGGSGANTAALGVGSRSWGNGENGRAGNNERRHPANESTSREAKDGRHREEKVDKDRRDRDDHRRGSGRSGDRHRERSRDREREYGRDRDWEKHRDRERGYHGRDRDSRRDSPGRKRDRDDREKDYDRHDKRRREDGDRDRDRDRRRYD
ncbi:hypothetical protein IAR50_005590 [Cryptococcus sp. DSM 104548]